MEVIGKIKYKSGDIQVTEKFKKSELVVTTDEQYPQHILIEFAQDKCDLVDPYQIGEQVKVSINLRGRMWTNPQGEEKYFNQIQGWRIERIAGAPTIAPAIPTAQSFIPATNFSEEDPDSLPF